MEKENERKLEEPECYLNKESGDLFIIWWIQNRPVGQDWIKISKKCYDVLTCKNVEGD